MALDSDHCYVFFTTVEPKTEPLGSGDNSRIRSALSAVCYSCAQSTHATVLLMSLPSFSRRTGTCWQPAWLPTKKASGFKTIGELANSCSRLVEWGRVEVWSLASSQRGRPEVVAYPASGKVRDGASLSSQEDRITFKGSTYTSQT